MQRFLSEIGNGISVIDKKMIYKRINLVKKLYDLDCYLCIFNIKL